MIHNNRTKVLEGLMLIIAQFQIKVQARKTPKTEDKISVPSKK